MKIKYGGDEWELVRYPGDWILFKTYLGNPYVKEIYRNDLSLEEFKLFLKEREDKENVKNL